MLSRSFCRRIFLLSLACPSCRGTSGEFARSVIPHPTAFLEALCQRLLLQVFDLGSQIVLPRRPSALMGLPHVPEFSMLMSRLGRACVKLLLSGADMA